MQMARFGHLWRGAALTAGLALGACQATTAAPPTKLAVNVRVPVTQEENPLASGVVQFYALIADYPGIAAPLNTGAQPYAAQAQVSLPQMPYGPARQIRVEMYPASPDGAPMSAIARGTSVPVDIFSTSAPVQVYPYVTKINNFAGIFGEPDLSKTELPGPHVAGASVALPSGNVLFAGGAVPLQKQKLPYEPASYGSFQQTVGVYNPDSRAFAATDDPAGQLAVGRAFHTMALGQTVVAIVGGVEMDAANKPRASNKVEFYNLATHEVTSVFQPDDSDPPVQKLQTLKFGRIAPTVVQMFEHQDYFLILGGKGNEDCPANPRDGLCGGNTWEIWHPATGRQAIGQLSKARWHHAGVRVPGPAGGFVMLVGGENTQGPVTTMEVVQFLIANSSVLVSDSLTNCPAECPTSPEGFLWNPAAYNDQPVRIWPSALFVANVNFAQPYYHVYVVGGFAKADHSVANKTVDIFDIMQSKFLPATQMAQGRAAPIVAAVTSGPSAGQVLIAGGSSTDVNHWNNGEFLHVEISDKGALVPTLSPIENPMADGDRALGAAVGLTTGHVLVLGGTGGTAAGLTPRTDALLWNPY